MSREFDNNSWRPKSLNTDDLFYEDTYVDLKIFWRNVKFENEPVDGNYRELCEKLSGEVVSYKNKKPSLNK
ncbi:hypothetical protein MUO14_02465 [Halobacillus shinanisalinarum]|uniref:Uncharacterized protein n=1 Tax=Halobacillus shinanisalinarum TaxID=2932258 RepID=A0ABY4H2M2_9BACI|nr:hypothetical protein [Halobacillus shinanisalinarum]UOQ93872.1 hypothetical protein MUO14_02465 [Halobacillus shinanisalinarum]